jgi:hypothetical protein
MDNQGIIVDMLQNLKDLSSLKIQECAIRNQSIEILELLAIYIIENHDELCKSDFNSEWYDVILKMILKERKHKLDDDFKWTKKNKKRFLAVNENLMKEIEKAYNKALVIANDYENKIQKDKSLSESDETVNYNIELIFTPWTLTHNPERNMIMALYDSGFLKSSMIKHVIHHGNIHDLPRYLDKSFNKNDYFYYGDIFEDHFISQAIHDLLVSNYWSFCDIIHMAYVDVSIKVIDTRGYIEAV